MESHKQITLEKGKFKLKKVGNHYEITKIQTGKAQRLSGLWIKLHTDMDDYETFERIK